MLIELQHVFARFSQSFLDSNVELKRLRVFYLVGRAALGGHVEICDGCDASKVFRGIFLAIFKKAFYEKKVVLPAELASF